MKSRLYSFEEFLNEAYRIIAEAVTWDQGVSPFVSILSGENDAKPLSRLRSMIKSAGFNNPDAVESNIAEDLERLVKRYNSNNGAKVKSVNLALAETKYNNLIAGKATCSGVPSTIEGAGGSVQTSGKEDINKVLIAVCASNIGNKGGGISKFDGKRIWSLRSVDDDDRDTKQESVKDLKDIDNTVLIKGSGIMNQRILTASGTEIKFERCSAAKGVITGVMDIPDPDFQIVLVAGKNASKSDAKFQPEANFDLVLYILKEINPNAGTKMPYESLKIEKIPVTTGGDIFPLNIQDDGVLFEKAKSDLREEGKKYISNAIANQFSSVEKIEVIGGASQEGKEDFNKKLCLDRAKAVAAFLTKDLGYPATASSETQIQPKESTADRKSWRKVTLKVTGKSRAIVTEETKDKVYYAESDYKLDQAVIVQAVYTVTVDGGF